MDDIKIGSVWARKGNGIFTILITSICQGTGRIYFRTFRHGEPCGSDFETPVNFYSKYKPLSSAPAADCKQLDDTGASAESPVVGVLDEDGLTGIEVGSVWQSKKNKTALLRVSAVEGLVVETHWLDTPHHCFDWRIDDFLRKYELLPMPGDDDGEMIVPYSNFDFGTADVDINTLTFGPLPMYLIGIAGPARAGKDTLADYLLSNLGGNWGRSSFADPMKAMLRVIGVDCSDDAKDKMDDYFGVTPRRMMQTLGTEWGRDLIDKDFWVKVFARMNAGKSLIVPDIRFENEAELIRSNGILIHLTGRGGINSGHKSENPVGFKAGDIVIDNSRDLEWLYAQVDGNELLSKIAGEGWGL